VEPRTNATRNRERRKNQIYGPLCSDGGHRHMVRGGHGLPKVSPGPAMPDPSTSCGRATPEKALRLFQGWPACRVGGLRPSSTPFGHPTPYAYDGGLLLREGGLRDSCSDQFFPELHLLDYGASTKTCGTCQTMTMFYLISLHASTRLKPVDCRICGRMCLLLLLIDIRYCLLL
jgi:hypothetical protein